MVQQAEEMRQADERKRESIDSKNQADSTIYNTEKMVNDHGDRIPQNLKDECNGIISELRGAMDADNVDDIKSGLEKL